MGTKKLLRNNITAIYKLHNTIPNAAKILKNDLTTRVEVKLIKTDPNGKKLIPMNLESVPNRFQMINNINSFELKSVPLQ